MASETSIVREVGVVLLVPLVSVTANDTVRLGGVAELSEVKKSIDRSAVW